MTIYSYGYDGSLSEKEFAILMSMTGPVGNIGSATATGVVRAIGDFKVTPVDGFRSFTIDPGWGYVNGVAVNSDAKITMPVDAPTGGVGQWWLLSLRRDWSTNTSAFVLLKGDPLTGGDTVSNDPADLRNDPGVMHDQKIAWILVSAQSTALTVYQVTVLAPHNRKTSGTSAERDLYIGNPASRIGQNLVKGREWYNTDGEWVERYYTTRNSPTGWDIDMPRPAGWYPIAGHMPMVEYMHLAGYNQLVPTGNAETVVTGIDATTRGYWGNGSQGDPSLGIGYAGNGVFNIGLAGRWQYSAFANYANTTSGTYRALGARTGGQGLVDFSRIQVGGSGLYISLGGTFIATSNDTFRLVTTQDAGSSQNFHLQWCRLTYLGPN